MDKDISDLNCHWTDLQDEHESSETQDAGGGEGGLQVRAGTGSSGS